MTTLIELCDKIAIHTVTDEKSWLKEVSGSDITNTKNIHTDKYYIHSYIPIYEDLFSTLQMKSINLLEIGIQKGGSLYLWKTYFPHATIYGVDIDKAPSWLTDINDVITYQSDAYTNKGLELFKDSTLDVIIDDGPHTLESMCFVAENYISKLSANGLLIIEDIPDIDWIDQILAKIPKEFSYQHTVYDLRSQKNRFDDILLVIAGFLPHTQD